MADANLLHFLADGRHQHIPRFWLAHTLHYQFGMIKAWFFTGKSGRILKKFKESINVDNLRKAFLGKKNKVGVYAYFVCSSAEDIEGVEHLQSGQKKLIYFSEEMVQRLLEGKIRPINGVLQQFIDPGFSKHTILEVVWSNYLTTFIQITNKQYLHSKVDFYEKCCTFDGPPYFSTSCSLKGSIAQFLKQEVQAIIRRVDQLSCESVTYKSLVCYFKKCSDGKTLFMFGFNLLPVVAIPSNISTLIKQNMKDRAKVLCRMCNKMQNVQCMVDQDFKVLFGNLSSQLKEERARVLLSQSESKAELDEGDRVGLVHLCQNCYLECVPQVKIEDQDELALRRTARVFSSLSLRKSRGNIKTSVSSRKEIGKSPGSKPGAITKSGLLRQLAQLRRKIPESKSQTDKLRLVLLSIKD